MTLLNHLFIDSSTGNLYDTRNPNWSRLPPLRTNYDCGKRKVETVADLKAVLRYGEFSDVGGYPLYFVCHDGAALSFEAVRDNLRTIMDSVANKHGDGWRVIAVDVNYEDGDLRCAHSGRRIPSAYGDDKNNDE